MRIAITREISAAIERCELTHLTRQAIDVERARAEHRAYEERLREAGYRLERLGAGPGVFEGVPTITPRGAESRRAETGAVAGALRAYRPIRSIEPPGTIDGGDVL